jgi:hypothetical protein
VDSKIPPLTLADLRAAPKITAHFSDVQRLARAFQDEPSIDTGWDLSIAVLAWTSPDAFRVRELERATADLAAAQDKLARLNAAQVAGDAGDAA